MSTYGTNEWVGEVKTHTIGGERMSFKYPEAVYNRYQHRYAVDSHNARLKGPISPEEILSTRIWVNHAFAVLLALLEVDANLGEHNFGGVEAVRKILEFRTLFSRDVYNNPHLRQDDMKSE